MKTFIIAPTREAARRTALDVGVLPMHPGTVFVLEARHLYGHGIRPVDRVVWSGAPWERSTDPARLREIDEAVALARIAGGSA